MVEQRQNFTPVISKAKVSMTSLTIFLTSGKWSRLAPDANREAAKMVYMFIIGGGSENLGGG